MKEIKDVVGYENFYRIREDGDIYSVFHRNNVQLKPTKSQQGYLYVTLCKDGIQDKHFIHRLVLEAFVPQTDMIVNHIDGNKLNNNYSNLEWCSYSHNNIHAITTGLRIRNVGNTHYAARPIICTTPDGIEIRFGTAVEAVASGYGTNKGHIQSCCIGRRARHNKNTWRYENV